MRLMKLKVSQLEKKSQAHLFDIRPTLVLVTPCSSSLSDSVCAGVGEAVALVGEGRPELETEETMF